MAGSTANPVGRFVDTPTTADPATEAAAVVMARAVLGVRTLGPECPANCEQSHVEICYWANILTG
jgi:hypothetical protein